MKQMRKFLIILFIYNPKEKIKKKTKLYTQFSIFNNNNKFWEGKNKYYRCGEKKKMVGSKRSGVCVWYANGFVSFTKKLFIIGLGFLMRPK